MMEDHLPLDIIIEPDVENADTLRQYKVLILPNAACLSAKANETIRAFVKAGGGLVAMHARKFILQRIRRPSRRLRAR